MIKRKTLILVTLTVGICMSFGWLWAMPTDVQNTRQDNYTNQSSSHPKNHQSLGYNDRTFIMETAEDGMLEVELGKLGTQRASSEDVKRFAQQMVDDHTKANNELMQMATQKGVTLPKDLDAKHKATLDTLSKYSGAEFDRHYMGVMVKDHEKAVANFRRAASQSNDPDLKAWASKMLPTLENHLQMARDINAKVGGNTTSTKKGLE